MKRDKQFILLTIMGVSFLQANTFSVIHESEPNWPIPLLPLLSVSDAPQLPFLMMWYFGFGLISFFVMGSVKRTVNGYGKYLFVRNYNRSKWMLFTLLKVSGWAIGLTLIQFTASGIVGWILNLDGAQVRFSGIVLIKSLSLYLLTIVCLLMVQMLLELFFSEITTFLLTNGYVTFSLAVWSYLKLVASGNTLIYLFVPNFMFPLKSIPLVEDGLQIQQDLALSIDLGVIAVITFMALRTIKKIDIF
ncbi:DUF2705 family protein [Sporolactobacillus terrae]|uniref:DUF2705 family protein n=1 Tax=Sporolactobacillus terrae TaxID=269673 RepID=UPI00048E1290|nr:DUF2705 family protein [Sporolactobacillus terrae]